MLQLLLSHARFIPKPKSQPSQVKEIKLLSSVYPDKQPPFNEWCQHIWTLLNTKQK